MLTFAITIQYCILPMTIQTHYQFKHIQKYITYNLYIMKTMKLQYSMIASTNIATKQLL